MKKECEWIVSAEELRERSKRAAERDREIARMLIEEKREKRREIFLIIFISLMFIALCIFGYNCKQKGIDNCIAEGNSRSFCVNNL